MSELLYPEYRSYNDTRIRSNDAIMALLAGSRLASHLLQLTVGSERTLRELFPAVEHIERFNLRSDFARSLLRDGDHHLASVAIPYALAVHEEYVMASIDALKENKIKIRHGGKPIKAWNMHRVLFSSVGYPSPNEWLQSFDLLREMRNSTVHAAGSAKERLVKCIRAMGPDATAGWEKTNLQRPADVIQDGKLILKAEHIFTAFAVTKRLGREINSALVAALPAAYWARVAVSDFQSGTKKIKNSTAWRRSLLGFIRANYGMLQLSENELEIAARDLGYWTLSAWT